MSIGRGISWHEAAAYSASQQLISDLITKNVSCNFIFKKVINLLASPRSYFLYIDRIPEM